MNFTPGFGTVQSGQGIFNPQKSSFQTGPLPNRREEKGAEKEIFTQARMFKRLHEDTL